MAFQFLPIIKVVAPYIAQVATAAIPAFTAKPDAAITDPVVAQQIEELQAAATQNAESIHLLADNLQKTIQGLEAAAIESRRQARLLKIWLGISLGGAGIALLVASFALIT